MRLVVVGGGIAGLTAAWAARHAARGIADGLEIVVLERGDDVGGKARSVARDGWLLEAGPGGFIGGRPEVDRLIDACGLSEERVTANEVAKRRFLFLSGATREIATDPVGFLRSGVLTPAGVVRLAGDLLIRAKRTTDDESVWSFAARRLGVEAADRIIAPMTLGIFAGDARQLSLAAAFPKMAALEREHGSLIRGLIARRGRTSLGPLTSFRTGMQALPRAIAATGGFDVRLGTRVEGLTRAGDGWRVAVGGDGHGLSADGVILACEPWVAARLLRGLDPSVAADLEGIAGPPVAVVGLGFGPGEATGVPRGFGILIARDEGLRALGHLWENWIFPARAPQGHTLIRAMFGGAVDPAAGTLTDDRLVALTRAEVGRLYGITSAPRFQHVVRWSRAIPQYQIGHLARVSRIEGAINRLGGLAVTGNGYRGVSFADTVTHGLECGDRMTRAMVARYVPSGRDAQYVASR